MHTLEQRNHSTAASSPAAQVPPKPSLVGTSAIEANALVNSPACQPSSNKAASCGALASTALAVVAAGGVAGMSWWLTSVCPLPKLAFNALHPFVSLLPITAWVVVRNCLPVLRRHYCAIPAFLGRHSLEFYLLQVSDTHLGHDDQALGQRRLMLAIMPERIYACSVRFLECTRLGRVFTPCPCSPTRTDDVFNVPVVSQHHVWMTNNAKAVVVVLPDYPVANFVLVRSAA